MAKLYRGILARRAFSSQKKALVKIQSLGRRFYAMKRYSDAQNAILILQSWARMHITREKFIIMRTLTLAVIKLQSYARMMITRKKFEETIYSIISIQSSVRMFLAVRSTTKTMKHSAHSMLLPAVTKLQAFYRMNSATKKFNQIIFSTIVVQNVVRMHLAMKKYNRIKVANYNSINISDVIRRALSKWILKMKIWILHKVQL